MSSEQIDWPCALVICTLNRPRELAEALTSVVGLRDCPPLVVVVDASATPESAEAVREIAISSPVEVVHLPASPGLPHQRNIGIEYVLTRLPSRSLIHFLDDDVKALPGYFEEIANVFSAEPDAVCVGGRDIAREIKRIPLATRLIGTNSYREGSILRTAWNIHSFSTDAVLRVEWLSGLSQTFRMDALGTTRFDEEIRFYGEDVDMHVRCSKLGSIYWTPYAEVRHFESTVNRADEDEVMMWTDGAKWMLCRNHPERFSKTLFLLSTVMHMALKAISGVLHRDQADLRTARGHARFLGRLVARKPMRQPVAV